MAYLLLKRKQEMERKSCCGYSCSTPKKESVVEPKKEKSSCTPVKVATLTTPASVVKDVKQEAKVTAEVKKEDPV